MIFLMIYAESFINILYSSKYSASVIPFRIYLFAIPIRIVYYSAALIALGKSKTILYRSMIDLCFTAILTYFFVLCFGVNGAPVGLILTMFIWTVPYNLYTLGKELKCKPLNILPFEKVGKILLISLFAGLISAFILFLNFPSIFLFFFGFLIFIVIYSLLAFRYINEFNQIIRPCLLFFKN